MELNSLLTRIGKSPSKPPEQFLCLIISHETVNSGVWQIEDNQTKIVSFGSLEEWEGKEDKLLIAADASLATALENITPEPNKVILGLPENWVEGDKISQSKQQIIKKLANKLTLKPIGFVVISEAIVNFLKQKEGTPPTAILIELTDSEATVSIIKTGKSLGSHVVGRSEDLGSDVEEAMARFKRSEPLPSRMLLVGSHLDLESSQQTLLSYAWQDKLPFLHFPKIEILDKDILVQAVAIAGGAEIESTISPPVLVTKPGDPSLAEHGFYPDKDILKHQKPKPQQPTSHFKKPHLPEKPRLTTPPHHTQELQPPPAQATPFPIKKLSNSLLSFFHRVVRNVKNIFNLSKYRGKKLPLVIALWLFAIILLVSGAVSAYLFIPKAQVTLYLNPKTITQDIDFSVVSGKNTDPNKSRLSGKIIEVELEDTLKKDTSGESLIGDKAQGEVTIFNKTNNSKKFPAGTTLTGPNNLQFELDESVNIASQSATDSGIDFGKADAKVTSVSVGTESNLPQDSSLSVKGFDSSNYSAKAINDFSGGSSKQIRAVSKEDREKLIEELTEKLESQANEQLKKETDSTETLVSKGFETEVVSREFNKAVGEEADSLELTLKLRLVTLKFKTEDALLLIQENMKDKIPEGFVSLDNAIQIDIDQAQVEDGTAQIEATLKTNLLPDLSSEEIIENLKGKYPETTENYLKSLSGFSRVEIQLTPKLPQKFATFPRRAKNITLNIEIEKD